MKDFPYIKIIIVLIVIVFAPIIPNDTPIECTGADVEKCDEGVGYVSAFTKFFPK